MMASHEVISAFLDDEPFDPRALSEALADPEGRALLIDLVALRRLTQPEDAVPVPARPRGRRGRRPFRLVAAAAVLTLAVVGGYQWGERSGAPSTDPPPATRVVTSQGTWQDVSEGVGR
jgi:hypothetical protein